MMEPQSQQHAQSIYQGDATTANNGGPNVPPSNSSGGNGGGGSPTQQQYATLTTINSADPFSLEEMQ